MNKLMDLLRDWNVQVRKIVAKLAGGPYARITNPVTSRPCDAIIRAPGGNLTINLTWYSQPPGGSPPRWLCDPPGLCTFEGPHGLQKRMVLQPMAGAGAIWVETTYPGGGVYATPAVKVFVQGPTAADLAAA